MIKPSEVKIAIIGLGYVGLPLAVEFGKIRQVVGFDINKNRIESLKKFHDVTFKFYKGVICMVEEIKIGLYFAR